MRKTYLLATLAAALGCSGGPSRVQPPSIDADDVTTAATDLAMAMSKLAMKAISTVSRLWLTRFGRLSVSAVTGTSSPRRDFDLIEGCRGTDIASWLPGSTQAVDR